MVLRTVILALVSILAVRPHPNFLQVSFLFPRILLVVAIKSTVKPRIVYNSRKLSSFFSLKDKTDEQHKHNLVYAFQCGECDRNYIGETGRRIGKRIDEHLTTDKKSHVYEQVAQTGHVINEEDFSIIDNGYGNYKKRKILEALHIHQKKLNLDKQKESVPLKGFI